MSSYRPAYRNLLETGELQQRVIRADRILDSCSCCAWKCYANRHHGKLGVCRTGVYARVSSYGPHLGEEHPLSGWRGSGTIFFSSCNMRCEFCQNFAISQAQAGQEVDAARLAAIMLDLQGSGCHNINLVSPSHVIPQILAAVLVAAQAGLQLPLVFNSGGFDNVDTLKLLDGVVDIYMPDMKYADEKIGLRYSRIPHYPHANQRAVLEMHRQVGDLQLDEHGLAVRGLLVRHLVLPGGLAGTPLIVRFLARKVSPHTTLNIMDQYHPEYHSHEYPELDRRVTSAEVQSAVELARAAGLNLII